MVVSWILFTFLFVLGCIPHACGKLVTILYDDPRILYDSGPWVMHASRGRESSTSNQAPLETTSTSVQNVCDIWPDTNQPRDLGFATSAIPGAGFSFEFKGTSAHILTTTNSTRAPYVVTRTSTTTIPPGKDAHAPEEVTYIAPGDSNEGQCRSTWSIQNLALDGTAQTLRVVVGDGLSTGPAGIPNRGPGEGTDGHELGFLGIIYDDGQGPILSPARPSPTTTTGTKSPVDAPKPTSERGAGRFIGIVLGISLAGLICVIIPLLCYCKRRGPISDCEGGIARRVTPRDDEKPRNILTTSEATATNWSGSVPSFLRGVHGTMKVQAEGLKLWADELTQTTHSKPTTSSFSRLTLLRPPLPAKDRSRIRNSMQAGPRPLE